MKCLVRERMVEKLLQLNKKLENLKPYYSRVRDYIKQPEKTRLDSKKLIKKAVENMNKINSQKYGFPPETIEKKALSDDVFRES